MRGENKMLEVRNLTKIYKTKESIETIALNSVSLKFPETGMVFLIGKSWSGKSTLLNVAGGLDVSTSGEILIKWRSSATLKTLILILIETLLSVLFFKNITF